MVLLEYLQALNQVERNKLLKDKLFVKKIFQLDERRDPYVFFEIVELYDIMDLLQVMDEEILNEITRIYPSQESVFINALIKKDIEVFEKYVKNNYYLTKFLLLKGLYLSVSISFSYDFVLYLINFMEENNLDYSKTGIYSLMFTSLNTIDLQRKLLNEKIRDVYKIMMLNLFNRELVQSYIDNNIINFKDKDIYKLIVFGHYSFNPNLYYTKSFFDNCIVAKTLYETRYNIEMLANDIDVEYFNRLLRDYERKIIEEYRNGNNS